MKFYLNNEEINVLNGATFSIKKDETLDSGKIELVFSEDKAPIKPMSEIRIEDTNDTYNFVVLSDTVEIVSKNPSAYKHTLEFAQNTKKLSKIQVRNTQFSQPAKNSLKCGCNATFQNIGTSGSSYMTNLPKDGEVEYSYQMEVSQRHKVKGSHFKINTKWIKFDSMSDGNYYETLQSECPKLYISYQLYKDGVYQYEKGAQYSDGDIDYIVTGLANGVYEIKNLKVMLLSDTTKYSTYDLFVVNITYIADVYYYTLYDVLDILRKQIALNEGVFERIDMPTILYQANETSSGNIGYNYLIHNPNAFDCYVYVKTWLNNEDEPISYENVGEIIAYNDLVGSKTFVQTRLHTKAYLIKKDDQSLISDSATGYKFIPPISYEYKLYLSDYGDKEDKYKLVLENQFQSDSDFQVARNGWQYIEDHYLYDISEYTYNETKSTLKDDKFTLYGYQTLVLKEPNIVCSLVYNSSSGGYDVKVRISNTNTKKCKIYWYAEGDIAFDYAYLTELESGGSIERNIGTVTTSTSGVVYAKCEYEEIVGSYGKGEWNYTTTGVIKPSITWSQYGNEYTYQATIKHLDKNAGTLYYRYKFLQEDTWSDWKSTTKTEATLILSNTTFRNKIAYIEAYSTVSDKTSETTESSQLIVAGGLVSAPTIDYEITNVYKGIVTINTTTTQSDAITYYKMTRNGAEEFDYKKYEGSFTISANIGSQDVIRIYAYTHSASAEGSSEVTSFVITLDGLYNLSKPSINVRQEYVASSSGYNVYVSFTNNSKITTDIYWYSTGTFAKSNQTISNVGAGETSDEILLGLSTDSSDKGVIYGTSKIDDYRSDTASTEWTNKGPVYYTLTVKYTGVNLSETTTEKILSGTVVNPSDYTKTYSGYVLNSIDPSTRFTMNSDTTITFSYLVGGKLDSPIFTEVSQTSSYLNFRVTNINDDTVTLYYVINPSTIPTSADDIISATDHYTISSISSSATESILWGGDGVLKIYGVFGSTSHSSTYDDSDVSSKTFTKRELSAPTITLQSSTSTSFIVKVYNPNAVSVSATDTEGNLKSISSRSSTTFTYSWSSSTQTVTITLSKSNYQSATASETFTRPIELSAPIITTLENTTERLAYSVKNPSSHDATFSFNSTVIAAGGSMTIYHIWGSDEETYSISGYFYNGYDIMSDTTKYTETKPSIPTVKLVAPTISYKSQSSASGMKWAITVKNLNSVDVTFYISGAKSDTKSVSANGSYTFLVEYYSTTDRTYNAMCYRVDTETTKYENSDTVSITIPSN